MKLMVSTSNVLYEHSTHTVRSSVSTSRHTNYTHSWFCHRRSTRVKMYNTHTYTRAQRAQFWRKKLFITNLSISCRIFRTIGKWKHQWLASHLWFYYLQFTHTNYYSDYFIWLSTIVCSFGFVQFWHFTHSALVWRFEKKKIVRQRKNYIETKTIKLKIQIKIISTCVCAQFCSCLFLHRKFLLNTHKHYTRNPLFVIANKLIFYFPIFSILYFDFHTLFS